MQLISFFSGVGGFELAGECMGWDIVSSCEINPFGQQVLKYYWPHAYHHDNVKTIDFEEIKKRLNPTKQTIFVAGFPCQPFSAAGKRKGTEDDRYGWPDCIKAVREIQPSWCVFENVRGLTNWNGGMVFDEVQADLEIEGYEVLPFLLPACAKDAPHRRDRIWFIAYSQSNHDRRTEREIFKEDGGQNGQVLSALVCPSSRLCKNRATADTNCNGQHRSNSQYEINTSNRGQYAQYDTQQICEHATNTGNKGLQGCENIRDITRIRENRTEQFAGLLPSNWEKFPTQSPICSRNDGLSPKLSGITFSKHRAESIKAYGNAIVPQVAFEIFKAIEKYENQKLK